MSKVEASREKVDIKSAVDYEKIFSTEFSNLTIHKTGEFDVEDEDDLTSIYDHGLDYYPAFMVYQRLPNGRYRLNEGGARIDKKQLVASGIRGTYLIFDANLEKPDPIGDIQTKQVTEETEDIARRQRFGIKISRRGQDAKRVNIQDSAVTSEARMPAIHYHKNDRYYGEGPYNVTHEHNLNYAPQYLFYTTIDSFGDNRYQQVIGGADDYWMFSTDTEFTFHSNYPGKWSYLILKDPAGSQ